MEFLQDNSLLDNLLGFNDLLVDDLLSLLNLLDQFLDDLLGDLLSLGSLNLLDDFLGNLLLNGLLNLLDKFLKNDLLLMNLSLNVFDDLLQVVNDDLGNVNDWVNLDDLVNLDGQFGLWNGLLGDLLSLLDDFLSLLDLLDGSLLLNDKFLDNSLWFLSLNSLLDCDFNLLDDLNDLLVVFLGDFLSMMDDLLDDLLGLLDNNLNVFDDLVSDFLSLFDDNLQFLDDWNLLVLDGDLQFVDNVFDMLLSLLCLMFHDLNVVDDLVDDKFDVVDLSDLLDVDLNVSLLGDLNVLLDNLLGSLLALLGNLLSLLVDLLDNLLDDLLSLLDDLSVFLGDLS